MAADTFEVYSLTSRLMLDASQFDRALDQSRRKFQTLPGDLKHIQSAATATGKAIGVDLGGAISSASGSLSAFGGPAGIAAGALIALTGAAASAVKGLLDLTLHVTEQIDSLGDLSEKVNFSVRTISGLSTAIEAAGSNMEGFGNALGIFDKNIEKVAQGDKRLSGLFKELGIDATNNERALRQVAKIIFDLGGTAQQTALAMELFGKSGKDVVGVIKAANGDIEEFIKQSERLGFVIGDDAVKAADDLDKSLITLRAQVDSVIRQLGVELIPLVQEGATNISNWMKNNQGEIRKTILEVGNLIKKFYDLVQYIEIASPITFVVHTLYTASGLLPDNSRTSGAAQNAQYQRNVFTQDPVTGRRVYAGNAPYNEPGEYAIAGGAGSSSVGAGVGADAGPAPNALADKVRDLLSRGGGGGKGGGKSQKDVLDSVRASLVQLNAEYRKYSAELLGSANAADLAAEKEKILSNLMRSLKQDTKERISEMRDVDEAISAAIGALPAKSREAARALVEKSLAQFKDNQEAQNAITLTRKTEELTHSWRAALDQTRGTTDEYADAVAALEKVHAEYGTTLDPGIKKELEQLAVRRRALDITLQLTRAQSVLLQQRERFATRAGRERPSWDDLGGGSTYGGEPATTGRPRVATAEEQVIRERLEIYRDNVRRVAYETTNLLDRALYDGFTGGGVKAGLASLGMGLLDIVRNIFLRELEEGLTRILTNAGGGKAAGGGGLFQTLLSVGLSAISGVFGGGLAAGGIGSAAAGAIGGFADGGYVKPNTWYWRGERGPELVKSGPMGDSVMSNGNSTAMARGGNTFITNVYAQDYNSFASRRTETQMTRAANKMMQRAA